MIRRPPRSTLFPYPPLFRSLLSTDLQLLLWRPSTLYRSAASWRSALRPTRPRRSARAAPAASTERSEEHTSELQSRLHLVCRLLLEKKKKATRTTATTQHAT